MSEQKKTKIHTVYKTRDGKRVPSVTTILNILNKPALIDWAWKCGCEGLDYKAVRDDAASVGTLAHYLIMCHLKKEKPDLKEYSQDDISRAENCLIKYWDWEREHPIKPIMVEESLVSEKYGFGGTIDCLAELNNEVLLIDHKTGRAIYHEMFYQLAAYKALLEENGHLIKNARILRIGRDENEGFEERVTKDLGGQWELFKHCLKIYKLQKEMRRNG
ncbi:MAG: PD-(D/E)XK nuclease family protein [Candidatus Odinarchaeota archaeon]